MPEKKALDDIGIAFLPCNGPTMTPEMFVDAAKAFRPDVVYPYHFSNTDVNQLAEALKNESGIEVRLRDNLFRALSPNRVAWPRTRPGPCRDLPDLLDMPTWHAIRLTGRT